MPMELGDLLEYARNTYHIEEEHKWADWPGFSVLSHPDTGKWIAVAETSLRLIYGVTCSRATVIDENWDRLPLSAHARPLWDLETAGSLGLDFCSCDTVPETETCPSASIAAAIWLEGPLVITTPPVCV